MKKTVLFLSIMVFGAFVAVAQTPAVSKSVSWKPGGTIMRSMNGVFTLRFQNDGNLVLYKNGNNPIWASQTHGNASKKFRFQDDGNLVIYDAADSAIWASNTNGKNGSYMVLQDDGNLVIYTINNQPVWATNTGGL
ncbi:bulb-type lectin domain-containing protein [Chryseobacterium sp. R2A-55]|uniref:bulb-type lectin domain-containing protein n=1 Tax=Chryseobacterium sp. R2A-55 TaxID=2744445 RepID=UPI001F2975E2|nr:bulb-type lectin domain-containing protein [Chryseobacterium sp. R2A-55]